MVTSTVSVRFSRSIAVFVMAAAFIVSGFFAPDANATVSNIVVTAPSNGLFWRGVQAVNWTANGIPGVDQVYLYYSTDNFSSGELIAGPVPYDQAGGQNWNTSGLPEVSSYKVKVTDQNAPFAGSNSVGTFTIDNTPPTTSATLNPASPDGLSGWYVTVPTITLSCTDGAGSGCNNIYYAWDSDTPTIYTVPLMSPEGIHTLHYYSDDNAVDSAGAHNVEVANDLLVKVDTQAPSVTSHTVNGGSSTTYFNPNGGLNTIPFELTANELVTWTTVRVIDINNTSSYRTYSPGTVGTAYSQNWNGSLISDPFSAAPDGEYSFTYTIEDQAGNQQTILIGSQAPLSDPHIGIDTVAPSIVSIILPTADEVYRPADTVPLTYEVSDPAPATTLACSYTIGSNAPVVLPSCPNTGLVVSEIDKGDLVDGRNSVV